MTWTGYPSYRDSGVAWLDDVPQDWSVRRLKTVLAEPLTYGANESADEANPSDPRFVRITDIADDGSLKPETFRSLPAEKAGPYMLQDGDLLFARSGATVGKSVLYSNTWGPCCFAGYLIRARLDRRTVLPRYVRYYSETIPYWQYISAEQIQATIQNVSAERYGSLPIPMPDLASQERIIQFLDREITKVDSLIGKQEQLIATLREDRTATITHAVTKGLDPDVDMKESGIGWLGSVPKAWTLGRIKHGFSVVLGKMYQGRPESSNDVLRPHLKAGSLTPDLQVDLADPMECWFSPSELSTLSLKTGDLLVVEGGATYGRCAIVKNDLPGWGFQKSLNRVRPLGDDDIRFVSYLIQAATECGHVSILCGKATIPHFTAEKLANLEWPHPHPNEQRKVADYLDVRCSQIDALIAKSTSVIKVLREYRSALITDAVTGKIDVREAV
ncbi:restriction endonuclease subunit S [Rhodococcus pyridinivorans]|nr:restriction endonuclease subunit S [Rhodococcus pyridinivorans]